MKVIVNRDYVKDQYVQKWLIGLAPRTKENYIDDFPEARAPA